MQPTANLKRAFPVQSAANPKHAFPVQPIANSKKVTGCRTCSYSKLPPAARALDTLQFLFQLLNLKLRVASYIAS